MNPFHTSKPSIKSRTDGTGSSGKQLDIDTYATWDRPTQVSFRLRNELNIAETSDQYLQAIAGKAKTELVIS